MVEAGNEAILEWTCRHCERRRIKPPRPYSLKMFKVRALKRAGYPFEKNDLTLEEWLDLGRLDAFLEGRNKP